MLNGEFFLILFRWKKLELQFNAFIEKTLMNLGIKPLELIHIQGL